MGDRMSSAKKINYTMGLSLLGAISLLVSVAQGERENMLHGIRRERHRFFEFRE